MAASLCSLWRRPILLKGMVKINVDSTPEYFFKLASSSAHANIKETFKQKRSKLDKNLAITASFLPFSKNAIVDKSAYKVENLFPVNNFVPQ